MLGHYSGLASFYYVVPDDPRFVHDVYVQVPPRSKLPQAPNRGDKVVVRLEAWESRHVNPEGEIIEVLGPASAPGVDMLSIVRKYALPVEFPKNVLEEANRVSERLNASALEGREDLRDKFIVTIDPDDARDFDDAIHVDKIDNQGWQLGVHIADVAAYVSTRQRTRSRSAPAREQRLPARSRDSDVAGAIE